MDKINTSIFSGMRETFNTLERAELSDAHRAELNEIDTELVELADRLEDLAMQHEEAQL